MKIGFIGLGKMGSRMVVKLLKEQHELVVWNRSEAPVQELKVKCQSPIKSGTKVKSTRLAGALASLDASRSGLAKRATQKLKVAETIEELVKNLEKPRVVWIMVTAGEATQNILDEVAKFVEKGDTIIDGGNSHFRDTQTRFEIARQAGIRFLDIGVSGGIIAAKEGYPLMVGGDKSAYEFVKPILDSLSKPNGGHEYFGEGGAGHFVKMVHNGIEYGIMQSLGEGFGVLRKAEYNFDLLMVAKLWQKGTLVSGFMLDRVVEVLSKDSMLSSIKGYIEESGEGRWMAEEAKKENVPIEIIEKSLEFRRKSQKDQAVQNSFAARLIAALRNAFGGHPIRQAQGKEVKKK